MRQDKKEGDINYVKIYFFPLRARVYEKKMTKGSGSEGTYMRQFFF